MYRRKGKYIGQKEFDRGEKVAINSFSDQHINCNTNELENNHVFVDHTYATCVPDISVLSFENVTYDSESSGLGGRIVIDISYLANELKKCKNCYTPLHLHNCIKQQNVGLASVLEIFCPSCEKISVIGTGKKHGNVYDVNTKIGTALLHSGIGVSQFNSLLGCLNLPIVSHTLINRRIQETGRAIEEVANETLQRALQEEAGTDGEAEVSVDAGWQKRGSGRSYDSLSGWFKLIL